MLKIGILVGFLLTSVACSKHDKSHSASVDGAGNSDDLKQLETLIANLAGALDADFAAKKLVVDDSAYQAVLANIRNMQDVVGRAASHGFASEDYYLSSSQLGYLSLKSCPLNTGLCPLRKIQSALGGGTGNYDGLIQSIDAQASVALQHLAADHAGNQNDVESEAFDTHPFLPLSGSEALYQPEKWNDDDSIRLNTNCYAYALNLQRHPQTGARFPLNHGFALQPGDFVNESESFSALNDPNGSEIIKLATADAAAIGGEFKEVASSEAAPKGSYKVALVIAPGTDYHWYRQNPDGSWSHKPGSTQVVAVDAGNQRIWDPKVANRNSGFIDYQWFVGYFEVKAMDRGTP